MKTAATLMTLAMALAIGLSFISKNEGELMKYHLDGTYSSTNPPTGKTGAPGETNCTDCHTGSVLGSSGFVFFTFSGGTTYEAGLTYTITLSVLANPKNGFEMTSFNAADAFVGDFIAGTNSGTSTVGSIEYIRHTTSVSVSSWTFDWVAPATDEGDITFYYAANRSNSSGSTAGDLIYTGSETISFMSAITWDFIPNDTTIDCGESTSFINTGQPSASTTCSAGGISITFTDVSVPVPPCENDSIITRTWMVTDACGGSNSFIQTITIEDTTGPVTICPTSQVLQAADGVGENILDYVPIASISDACTPYASLSITQTPAPSTYLLVGPNNINIQAADACGNTADCDFTLEIYVTASLTMVSFPSDTTVECDHSLDTALLGTGLATTTCPVTEITYSYTDDVIAGSCIGESTINRNWTATDVCGNSATYSQVINTIDTEPPFIACTVSDTTANSTNGINAFLGDYAATAAVLDNCSPVVVTQSPIPAAVIPVGVKEVWLFATDDCGNVDSCSLSVVIGDTTGLGSGISEQLIDDFKVFPNPNEGLFTIKLPIFSGKVDLTISNVTGEKVYQRNDLAPGTSIEVELDKASGIYLVELTGAEGRLVKKIRIR